MVAALFGAGTPWLPVLSGAVVAVGGLLWASWRRRAAGRAGIGSPSAGLRGRGAGRRRRRRACTSARRWTSGDTLRAAGDRADRRSIRSSFPSPLVGFRKYFKDQQDAELFTVTGLPAGARVRLAALDDYNGVTFDASTASGPVSSGSATRSTIRPWASRRPSTSIIDDYRGVYLPIAGHLTGADLRIRLTGSTCGTASGIRAATRPAWWSPG